jgi:hypothetical protein
MVLEEAANVAGVYDAAMLEPGKVLRSFPRLLNDMQLAFGEVLLEGFGPVIKAAYDFTKQLSYSVREGGAFAPILDSMREAFTSLVTPLTEFINKMVDGMKALNESGFSISNLTEDFQRLAPMVAAAGSALAMFAGSNVLQLIPGLDKLGGLLGGGGPIAVGLAVLVGTSPELRASFIQLAKAVEPLAVAASRLAESAGTLLVASLETLIEITTALVTVLAPVIEALASLAELVSRNEVVMQALAAAIIVLVAKQKLFGSETAIGTRVVGAMSKSLSNLAAKYKMAYVQIQIAGTATTAFGARAAAGFAVAKAAALSFIASVAPLVIITGAVYALGKAFEYFNNRGKDVRERTEELVPVINDLTQAFIEGEEAAEGFSSGMDVVMAALTAEGSEETDKFKDALMDLGVEFDDLGKQMLALEDNFDVAAEQILRNAGLHRDLAADMLKVVNGTDDNGDSLVDYADYLRRTGQITSDFTDEQIKMLKALEETQDQTENLDGPTTAAEGLLELRRAGQLSLEAYERFNQEIIDGAPAFDVYTRAVDEAKAAVEELTEAEAARNAEIERAEFMHQAMLERLNHVSREYMGLTALGYENQRMHRNMAKAVNDVADELASLEDGSGNLVFITDKFIDTVGKQVQIMEEAEIGADRIAATQQVMAANFYATAVQSGATAEELEYLRRTLILLDKIDPSIDIELGLTAENIAEQLANARAELKRFTDMLAESKTFSATAYEAARDLVETLELYASVVGQADAAQHGYRTGTDHATNSASKMKEELEDTNKEVLTLTQRFRELTSVLLGPAFAENEAVVFLEEMRDAALELARAMNELSEAQALQAFNQQVQASIGQIQDLYDAGADADAISQFINGLIGPGGALFEFAATAGISEQDFAQSFAAIQAAANTALNDLAFFDMVAGMTPEEIEQMEAYFAGLPEVDDSPVPMDVTGAAVGGGTTTININMPTGVTGQQVVDAMTEYAQTEGATVQASWSFVNN